MFTLEEKIIGCLIATASTAILALIANRRSRKVAETIGKTMEELSKKDYSSEIAKEFIEEAAKASVEKSMDAIVHDLAKQARKDARKTFDEVIQKEVNNQYADTKSLVTAELKKKIGEIDISDAKREVIIDAKRIAADKFKQSLEEVVRDFRERLSNTNEIYSQFAKMFKVNA